MFCFSGNATEEITKLNGSQERNVTLTNLRPYTTYKLQISIISLDGSQQIQLGPRSVAKRFLTLEDGECVSRCTPRSYAIFHRDIIIRIKNFSSKHTFKLGGDFCDQYFSGPSVGLAKGKERDFANIQVVR